MSGPLVSVVIPAYNHAGYLEAAIRSVLDQTYRDLELIVLDDGSTDGTRALLERLGGGFRWESQPNMGQARTLNKGWSMSRGEILAYLSADDFLHPAAVAEAVRALEEHPQAVVVYPDFALVDARGRPVYETRAREYAYLDAVRMMVTGVGVGGFFRRAAFERAGGWNAELRRMPDLDFWLRLGLHGAFRRIPKVLAYHRVHEGSETYSQPDAGRADESLRIINDFYGAPGLPPSVLAVRDQARASAHLLSARLHCYAGRHGTGLARFLEALRLDPSLLLKPRGYRAVIVGLLGRIRWRLLSALKPR